MSLKPQPKIQTFGIYQLEDYRKQVAIPTDHVHEPVDLDWLLTF